MAAVLPALRLARVQLIYLSGKSFNLGELLYGRLTPEPLIAAHASIIDDVRAYIRVKEEDSG